MIVKYGDVVRIKRLNFANEAWASEDMNDHRGQYGVVFYWKTQEMTGDREHIHFYIEPLSRIDASITANEDICEFWWAEHSFDVIGNIFTGVGYLDRLPGFDDETTTDAVPVVLQSPVMAGGELFAGRRFDGAHIGNGAYVGITVNGNKYIFDRYGILHRVDTFDFSLDFAEYMLPTVSCEQAGQRFFCPSCNRHYTETVLSNEELEAEEFLCPNCRKREFVLPYHHWTPKFTFWREPRQKTNLYFGMEIEADKGGESDDTARYVVQHANEEPGKWFMYVTHDGSLDRGIEMVTAPCTLKYHLAHANKYRELFRELVKRGYRAHNTTTCGLHIHFSREYYADNEEENISKLLYLVEKFWDDISILSRRNYKELSQYYKKTDEDADSFIKYWNKTGNHDGHYYAVNITNKDTIELRMFRGTLNVTTMLATLEFADKLVRTAKHKTVEELQRLKFTDLLTPASRKLYEARCAILNFEDTNRETEDSDTQRVVRTQEIRLHNLPF